MELQPRANGAREVDQEDEDEAVAQVLAMAAAFYANAYYFKEPCRDSALTGAAWVHELQQGHPTRMFENLRMTKRVFSAFCVEIERVSPTSRWARVSNEERCAIFLYSLARQATSRDLQERFQRSGETIHRHFHAVIDAVCALAKKFIVLPRRASPVLAANPKYASQFDRCRLAFDGTHIPMYVPAKRAKPYRNRKGELTQNVFAACTFDLMFAYVVSGWEGSAADSTVLAYAQRKGFHTPHGLFDLGDAGYGLTENVLTPYRGVRYHLREWGQASERPKDYKELYNLRHAQARNVIERAFGVLKRRFRVLQVAPEYSVQTQSKIVLACCVLHNFIRLCNDPDDDPEGELEDEEEGAEDTQPVPEYLPRRVRAGTSAQAKAQRDQLAKSMWNSYVNYRR